MKWITRCPAKINTFLAVGPVDSRRYHPIRSIFQAVSLVDELTVEIAEEPSLEVEGMVLPPENTLTKALRLYRELIDLPPLRIHLRKEIPAQAGLGGGSTDAAGLLRILRRIEPDVPWDHASHVAAAVGADVPFFLVGGMAKATGYGEILEPMSDSPRQWLVIAQPAESCSTVAAYQALDAKPYPWRDFPADLQELYNDFERVAPCGSLDLIERLQIHGCSRAGLTGSGSAVFGFCPDEVTAESVAAKLEGAVFVRVCHTLTREESLWIS